MKLERYKDKKETRKKVILISLTVVTIVSITMMLYKTFAKFTTSTSFSIMSGKVLYKKKGLEFGKDIPVTDENSDGGLYEVTHTGPVGWEKKEYRYGGKNVNNYVYFNCATVGNESSNTCEKWRIIGKVNVKTNTGKMEQRIKIVNPTSLSNLAWDSKETNNWVSATGMKYLNSNYYNGLKESAKDMIDKELTWPLGGTETSEISAEQMYQNERGTNVDSGNALEWNSSNTIDPDTNRNDSNLFRGIGLMYASDYGFAFGGSSGRECISDLNDPVCSGSGCACTEKNWIYINNVFGAFITHKIDSKSNYKSVTSWIPMGKPGAVQFASLSMITAVFPSIYISSKFHITHGNGTISEPFVLGE